MREIKFTIAIGTIGETLDAQSTKDSGAEAREGEQREEGGKKSIREKTSKSTQKANQKLQTTCRIVQGLHAEICGAYTVHTRGPTSTSTSPSEGQLHRGMGSHGAPQRDAVQPRTSVHTKNHLDAPAWALCIQQ